VSRRSIVLAAALLASCAGSSPAGSSEATPPVDPPADPAAELRFSCGDDLAFPAEALFGPVGAELAATEQAAVLRAFLAQPGPEVDMLPDAGWRLVVATVDDVMFIAGDPARAEGLERVLLERSADGWEVGGWGGCTPIVVLAGGLGPAEWVLDPAAPPPGPGTRTFTALVTERSCASGRAPDGRIAPPFVSYGGDSILVVFGVRSLVGGQDCPSNPAGRVVVELREPLGDRRLLDGAFFPPRDVTQPAGG
jgi:hypothetical protein